MFRVFYNWYKDKSGPIRQKEIDETLHRWYSNPYVDIIVCFIEKNSDGIYELPAGLEKDKKIVYHFIDSRPTFKLMFDLARTMAKEGDVSAFTNSDCYLTTEACERILLYLKPEECYTLSRWDREPDRTLKLFNCEGSQDCWIFRGPIREMPETDFYFGRPGCDHRVGYEISKAGYNHINPAKSIQLVHLHASGVRYPEKVVDGPYHCIWLSYLDCDK